MKYHELKIDEKWFDAIVKNEKTCEVRKNDRNFEVGDIIHFTLAEDASEENKKKAENLLLKITHVLTDQDFPNGIMPGYCVISFKKGTSTFKADK